MKNFKNKETSKADSSKRLRKNILLLLLSLFSFGMASAQNNVDSTSTFRVYGECVQCQHRIENALKIKGVQSANWDITTKILNVVYDPSAIHLQQIKSKILSVGHDLEDQKADDKIYNALPECCHYRDKIVEEPVSAPSKDEHSITGIVVSEDTKGNFIPLEGASIFWNGSTDGTVSDKHGFFSIPENENNKQLVVTYAGFQSDSIDVGNSHQLQVVLASNGQLKAIKINGKPKFSYINGLGSMRSLMINSNDLLKAACCNLSESFETNPSVDVSYSDAVTGSRQIELLGLAGIYTQLTVENLPGPRGIATPLGLNSIAGPWIESIQLSKGTGSVANGYESIAGQINVELKKPETSEKLYVNAYTNDMGKTDINANMAEHLNGHWSTIFLLHDDFLFNKIDFNKDGFRDLPTGNLFSGVNEWNYTSNKGLEIHFGAKALIDNKTGGQVDYNPDDKFTTNHYGLGINTNRYEGFAKIGYIFPEKKYQSIGLQLSTFNHDQNSYFGLIQYNAQQSNFYSNLIYQSIIGNSSHKFRAGLSFNADYYNELYKTETYKRNEIVPGAFFEYTYNMNDKFSAVAGLRADHDNLFGWFVTPRLNVRYEPVKGTVIHLSGGRGQRTANIFAENTGALVSARSVQIISNSSGKAYGLNPEVAWNKGITIDQKMKLFSRDAMLSFDFYRNDFVNQVVADLEDPRVIKFYNLIGKSFSNSFQAEFNFIPVEKLDVRLAYRWYDVRTSFGNQLLEKPFTAANRAFINLGYEIKNWKFNYTVNYIGRKRIPSTKENPVQYQMPEYSPSYISMNAQVSKAFGKNKAFELYLGGENLTNYFQKNVIISADQPFGKYFDASMVWGPVSGRLLYGGLRYKIK
ncbi:MAG TPA: carboxypeptidase-like regulatory domain-containing protein [Hanamia sp.]|nr:carboxypeptidase-like regulatory domain-containing protein [Hanamia sp.]